MRVENTFWYGGILPVPGTEWGQSEYTQRFRYCMSQWAGELKQDRHADFCLAIGCVASPSRTGSFTQGWRSFANLKP